MNQYAYRLDPNNVILIGDAYRHFGDLMEAIEIEGDMNGLLSRDQTSVLYSASRQFVTGNIINDMILDLKDYEILVLKGVAARYFSKMITLVKGCNHLHGVSEESSNALLRAVWEIEKDSWNS